MRSPGLMIPFARKILPITQVMSNGSTKQIRIIPTQSNAPVVYPSGICAHPVITPIAPTRPEVPIPDEIAGPLFRIWNTQVAIGPVIAEVITGGSQRTGFFIRFGTWSMEVPRPCATNPPIPLSGKLKIAKPSICAQHPAVAAPPASASPFQTSIVTLPSAIPARTAPPLMPIAAQIAAELIGSVRTTPTTTDTMIPIQNGLKSVAHPIKEPSASQTLLHTGARSIARITPTITVTAGVTMMSIFVSLETSFPISQVMTATKNTASGPPEPPIALQAAPTAHKEYMTSGGA